jgi:hypothetical protein
MKARLRRFRLAYALYTLAALVAAFTFTRWWLYRVMYSAILDGNAPRVRLLLKLGLSPNGPGGRTAQPLQMALGRGQTQTALMLIRAGAKGVPNGYLCEAVRQRNLVVTSELIRRGADANGVCLGGVSPLMLAIERGSVGAVHLLLDHGADVNFVCMGPGSLRGETALARAVTPGDPALVRLLLDRGADPNVHFDSGRKVTPLIVTASTGDIDIVRILLAYHADVNARDWSGHTALAYAKTALVNAKSEWGRTHKKQYADIIALLKRAGARETPPIRSVGVPPRDWKSHVKWAKEAVRIKQANANR